MWALVPLKSPLRAKSRLAGVLDPLQRERLVVVLAERVIGTLRTTPGISQVAVITASPAVAALAGRYGAQVIREAEESGSAAAFVTALRHLHALQLPRVLMISADLPLLSTSAVQRMIEAAGDSPGIVLAPDRHRVGTNALLCTPPQLIEPCFGPDSFCRHLAAAAAAGIEARIVEDESLALDLDTPDDLECLRTHGDASARAMLDALHWAVAV
jgi:2-phospho-L-lactate guanylyltransferase